MDVSVKPVVVIWKGLSGPVKCSRHSSWTACLLKMAPTAIPTVINLTTKSTLRNVLQERRPPVHRGGSLQPCAPVAMTRPSHYMLDQ